MRESVCVFVSVRERGRVGIFEGVTNLRFLFSCPLLSFLIQSSHISHVSIQYWGPVL